MVIFSFSERHYFDEQVDDMQHADIYIGKIVWGNGVSQNQPLRNQLTRNKE